MEFPKTNPKEVLEMVCCNKNISISNCNCVIDYICDEI